MLLKYGVFVVSLLLLASCSTSNWGANAQLQACALYGTNNKSGYPIPLLKCKNIREDIACDEKSIDSEKSSKIWRSYPAFMCNSPHVVQGLTERYLLEGVD